LLHHRTDQQQRPLAQGPGVLDGAPGGKAEQPQVEARFAVIHEVDKALFGRVYARQGFELVLQVGGDGLNAAPVGVAEAEFDLDAAIVDLGQVLHGLAGE
jgi:hypothetical protein